MAYSLGLTLYNLSNRRESGQVDDRPPRPLGRLVWLHAPTAEIARSMLELERRTAQRGGDGWKTAQSYMQRMLQRHVARRDSFGNNDLEIVNQLLLDGAFSSQTHNRSHGTAGANAERQWHALTAGQDMAGTAVISGVMAGSWAKSYVTPKA